jgi:hypothetical protein
MAEKKFQTPQEVAAEFRRQFDLAMQKQVNEFNPDEVTKLVISRLNEDRKKAIWRLLGLDDRWGTMEVNTSNRNTSPIIDWCSAGVQEEVNSWMAEVTREIIAEHRTKLKAEYRKVFKSYIEERTRWYAQQRADEDAKSILNKISEETTNQFMEGVRNARYDEEAQRKGTPGQADQA